MSGALIKRRVATLPRVTQPRFVAEVERRPLAVERPVPTPPKPPRTSSSIPPPLPSVSPRDLVPGAPALLEDTLRLPALKATRVTPARVTLIACAMVVSVGAGAIIGVASSSAHRPQPQAIPLREREVTTPLPVVQSISTAVVDVAPRNEVSLVNVHVLWGKVSRLELSRAMRRSLTTIERCLEQHPHEAQAPSQDAVLRLRLDRNGRVRGVHASSLAPADGCIARSLRQARFPRNTTGVLADLTLRLSE